MSHPRNIRPTLVGLPRPQTILPPPVDEAAFPLSRSPRKSYVRWRTEVLYRPPPMARPELAGFGPAHMVAAVLVCAAVMAALKVLL